MPHFKVEGIIYSLPFSKGVKAYKEYATDSKKSASKAFRNWCASNFYWDYYVKRVIRVRKK